MAAPPGFDYKSSMLPDVGGAIHVQGGGGMNGGAPDSSDDLKILTEYGLHPGGIIDDKVDMPTKMAFLEQLRSGACSDSGNSVIVNKKCWAVVAVIRALIKRDLGVYGSEGEPSLLPTPPPTPPTPSPTPPTPPPTPPTPSPPLPPQTLTLSDAPAQNPPSPAPEEVVKVDSRLQLDTNKEEFFANLSVKGKPTRVRAKAPVNLTQRYKNLSGGKKKHKTQKARKSKSKVNTRKKYRA